MRFTIYKNSVLATIISIIGAIFAAVSVVGLMSGAIVEGIIGIAIGVAMMFAASAISDNKEHKNWVASIQASGIEPQIASDMDTAIQIYNSKPGKKTLEYIRTLNPAAAARIQEMIDAQKNAPKQ